ncbi:MAG TPA: hypothetical protein VFV37_02200 [Luteibaculaceae bacterium]|nr:hypothetical protein [Luteibaculaceae bacterium]
MNVKYLQTSLKIWLVITGITLAIALYQLISGGWEQWTYLIMVGLAGFMTSVRFFLLKRAKRNQS